MNTQSRFIAKDFRIKSYCLIYFTTRMSSKFISVDVRGFERRLHSLVPIFDASTLGPLLSSIFVKNNDRYCTELVNQGSIRAEKRMANLSRKKTLMLRKLFADHNNVWKFTSPSHRLNYFLTTAGDTASHFKNVTTPTFEVPAYVGRTLEVLNQLHIFN